MTSPRIAIIGSGSWATALAKLFLNNTAGLNWYIRKEEDITFFNTYIFSYFNCHLQKAQYYFP
jgi:glycerol-3-phosphate dehydrogenase (NAD(P)+)